MQFYPTRAHPIARFLILAPIAYFAAAYWANGQPESASVFVVLLLFIYAFNYRSGYEIGPLSIAEKRGLLTGWRLQFSDIARITPASLDGHLMAGRHEGVRIDSKRGVRTVAVPDREAFFDLILQRAPHLYRFGEELRSQQPL